MLRIRYRTKDPRSHSAKENTTARKAIPRLLKNRLVSTANSEGSVSCKVASAKERNFFPGSLFRSACSIRIL